MQDKRQYTRTPVDRPVTYIGMNLKGQIVAQGIGRALDINQKGMMFESTEPVDAEMIKVRISDSAGNFIEADGMIIYSMPIPPGQYRTGIRFSGSAEQVATFVAEICK